MARVLDGTAIAAAIKAEVQGGSGTAGARKA